MPIFSIAFTAPPSRQCGCVSSACPGRPSTVTTGVSEPRLHVHTSNPVGSVQMPASARTPCCTHAMPPAPDDSSSVFVQTTRSPPSRTPSRASVSAANTMLPMPPFMSHVPRPKRLPSRISARHGSLAQRSMGSGVTTSMCPFSSSERPPPAPANVAASCGRPANSSCGVDLTRAGHVGRRRLPDVDLAPRAGQAVAEVALQVGLLARRIARRARGRVERDEVGDQPHEIVATLGDRVADAALQVAHRAASSAR